jgi:serine/threonine-protein kinase HipA
MIELPHLLASSRAVETGDETEADLRYLRGRGTSLGGLRPKCTVIDDAGRLSIGKFPSIRDNIDVTSGEVLALRLARLAGINAAEATLVNSDGSKVALIRRFDRIENGGRIPYASAATLLGPEAAGSEHTYSSIVDLIRTAGAATSADIEELWRRIAFSILITNTDDHLRNHGFLHTASGLWRLSPAFDINPTPGRARELKTPLSEDAGADATIKKLMSLVTTFRIPLARAKEILGDVEAAVDQWRDEGRKLGMTARDLDAFAEAFEHEERAEARREASQRGRSCTVDIEHARGESALTKLVITSGKTAAISLGTGSSTGTSDSGYCSNGKKGCKNPDESLRPTKLRQRTGICAHCARNAAPEA